MKIRLAATLLWLAVVAPLQAVRAQVQEPVSGGGVSPTRMTATTLELTFGTTGTGQGRVVAIAVTPNRVPLPLEIINDTFYPANAEYGQGAATGKGFAIYNGPGHSVVVTGLQPATSYYVATAEYNTDNTHIVYNTRSSSVVVTTPAAVAVAPLPVELVSFTGAVDAAGLATLRWTTASERNADYFAVERSADGAAFVEAGRVSAAGNSAQALDYRWPDPQRLAQLTYYRLRQADRDGTVHYSAALALAPPLALAAGPGVEVYPVPSAGQPVHLLLRGYESKPLSLRLTNSLGQVVLTQILQPTSAQYSFPLLPPSSLAEGTYILTLADGGNPIQKRLVISY